MNVPAFGAESVLEPFVSDGCTLIESWTNSKFTPCCVEHDFAYWIGGTLQDKNRADAALINCLRSKGANNFTAGTWQLLLANFGDNFWSRDWNPPRKNTPLTAQEWEQVRKKSGQFKDQIPLVQTYSKGGACLEQLEGRLNSDTGIKDPKGVSCYGLLNNELGSNNRAILVYSNECRQGYFIYEYQNISHTTIENGELNGYGLCADMMKKKKVAMSQSALKYKTAPVSLPNSGQR